MIERPRERDRPKEARAPERRLQTDASAERCRDADAPPGVAPERGVGLARDDGHRRAARRPAGYFRRVPRIANVSEVRVDRADAVRELVEPELAEKHRAGLAKLAHDRRVLVRHPLREDSRARGRADALRREEVLDRDRDAVQRTPVPTGLDLALSVARLFT